MKIIIAKTAGFCMGVRRAVEMVMVAPQEHTPPICTYGPLIHNPQVLELLEERGISILATIPAQGAGTVLLRAHGVPPTVKDELTAAGFTVIDATCPRVIKVQTIIRKHTEKGFATIIIGDRDHPEVVGLLGYARGQGHVAATLEELQALPAFPQAIVVAQTTQNTRLFDRIKEWTTTHHPHYKIYDTICDSTEKRQSEVQCLAALVDAVVVVGGKESGNTQRLYEIARESGKPTFHVESEADLDLEALAEAQCIGVTAGASTPNWQIKKICRALESVPFRGRRGWQGRLFRLQRTLLLTNIYVAMGAGCLAYTAVQLVGQARFQPYLLLAMLYVLSMHVLNHLIGSQADHYNDPERAKFYVRHRPWLALLAVTAGASGLMIAALEGLLPFSVLLVMSLLGLSYNLRILPASLSRGRIARIRDIPGSKTFLIALAWGVVTAVLPALAADRLPPSTLPAFAWATGMAFVRTAFFDLLDIQSDRIFGKETLPVVMGEAAVLRLLKRLLVLLALLPPAASLLGLATGLGWILPVCPLLLGGLIAAHERGRILPGIRLEFAVESHFVLAGLLSFLWSLLPG
jgi:(E)-4-hydroxy-3-methyl-but-2-enyl pyrophosphate reductase